MNGTALTQDDLISVGRPLPRVARAAPLENFRVEVAWSLGERADTVEIIDLAPAIMKHRHFAPLRSDPARFATIRVNEDGNALEWDGGIELSAVWSEDLANRASSQEPFQVMSFVKYRDPTGRWRWRLVSADGRLLAENAASFPSEAECDASIRSIRGSTSVHVTAA